MLDGMETTAVAAKGDRRLWFIKVAGGCQKAKRLVPAKSMLKHYMYFELNCDDSKMNL